APAAATRRVSTPVPPPGIAIAPNRIWFGDAASGTVYAVDRTTFAISDGPIVLHCPAFDPKKSYMTTNDLAVVQGDLYAVCSNFDGGSINRLDANSGAIKADAPIGPVAVAITQTGDGRIAVVSGADNTLRLVTPGTMAVEEAYTFASQTS